MGDLEATSKKTSGRQEIIFCKPLAVKGLNISRKVTLNSLPKV